MTAAQIKIDHGIIERDRNKTGADQAIPIDATPQLRAVVEELLAQFKRLPNTNGLLFTINGQAIDEGAFEYAFKKACKAAQLSDSIP